MDGFLATDNGGPLATGTFSQILGSAERHIMKRGAIIEVAELGAFTIAMNVSQPNPGGLLANHSGTALGPIEETALLRRCLPTQAHHGS